MLIPKIYPRDLNNLRYLLHSNYRDIAPTGWGGMVSVPFSSVDIFTPQMLGIGPASLPLRNHSPRSKLFSNVKFHYMSFKVEE